MSTTNQSTSSNLAIKVWARQAFNDAVKATTYGKLTGTSDRSIVQVKNELKSEGDKVTFGLRALPSGIGVQDDETLEGNEEGLEFKDFAMYLGEKRHAFKVDLNLSAQRTMFNVRAEAKEALNEWLEEYLDCTFFEYLTGMGAITGDATASKFHPRGFLGGNALSGPSTNRIVYGGTATADANITVTDTFSLAVLDRLAERLKLASPTIRKASFGGKSCYVVILHPYQVNDLRNGTATGQWFDIQKAAMQGGKVTGNPIFEESLGMYRDFLLIESTRIPTFLAGAGNAVSCARAVCLSAQAAVVAHGKGTDNVGKLAVVDRTFDYGKRYGVAVTLIWGMAKTKFNGQEDFGVFAIDTAAKAH